MICVGTFRVRGMCPDITLGPAKRSDDTMDVCPFIIIIIPGQMQVGLTLGNSKTKTTKKSKEKVIRRARAG